MGSNHEYRITANNDGSLLIIRLINYCQRLDCPISDAEVCEDVLFLFHTCYNEVYSETCYRCCQM